MSQPHSHQNGKPLWQTSGQLEPEVGRDHGGIPVRCQFCIGQSFRRSRLRANDIGQLLLMRYPVRCTRCSQRQAVSFTVAGASLPSHIRSRVQHDSMRSHGSRRGDGAGQR